MTQAEAFEGGFLRDLDEDEKKRFTPSELLLYKVAVEHRYITVHTGTAKYVLVHTSTYYYIRVYRYVQNSTYMYILVHTSSYMYILEIIISLAMLRWTSLY
jgi:hypothetical protein